LNEQMGGIFVELEAARRDVSALYDREGWSDMEDILRAQPSLQNPEPGTEPEGGADVEWSRKWGKPWKNLYNAYLGLTDRCSILEARRAAVLEKLLVVQAKYVGVVLAEVQAGREAQGKEVYGMVEMLDRMAEELNAYALNSVGLYGPER
ncbi:MAG: hypothetical protein ACLGPL_05415, partial [Acidobacteriota bacterium]